MGVSLKIYYSRQDTGFLPPSLKYDNTPADDEAIVVTENSKKISCQPCVGKP